MALPVKHQFVLIIDDDKELTGGLVDVLAGEKGIKAIPCYKLTDAIVKLNNQRFDLVVLDLHFGPKTSEEVINHMRTDPRAINRHTQVLMISGQLDESVILRLKTNIAGVLVKPFDRATFIEKVKSMLPRLSATVAAMAKAERG